MFKHPGLFEKEALDVARYILNERKSGSYLEQPITTEKLIKQHAVQEVDPARRFFKTKFFSTFSWREVYSAIAISLLSIAIKDILDFYHDEDWLEEKWYSNEFLYMILILPLLHIFYKRDHKRPNDFLGRSFHIFSFFLALFCLQSLKTWIIYGTFTYSIYSSEPSMIFFIPFGILIIVFMFEIPYSLIKHLFYFF